MESCAVGGDKNFCEFYNFMLKFTEDMVQKSWFSDINCHIQEDPKYEWDDEKQEYIRRYPNISFVGIEKLKDPLTEVIKQLNLESHEIVASFRNKLTSFDFVDFYDTKFYPCSYKRRKRQAPDSINETDTESTLTSLDKEKDLNNTNGVDETSTAETMTTTTSDILDYYDYDYEMRTEAEIAEEFYNMALENVANLTTGFLEFYEGSAVKMSGRRKREVLTNRQKEMCTFLVNFPKKLGELKDGPVWSIAKISVAQLFYYDQIILREEILGADEDLLDLCNLDTGTIEITKNTLIDLDNFRSIKDFDDGMSLRLDPSCHVPDAWDTARCTCECHKKEKLLIANIFILLKSMETFNFTRGGDLFTWYYNEHMRRSPEDMRQEPNAPTSVSKEIIDFDTELMKELRYL